VKPWNLTKVEQAEHIPGDTMMPATGTYTSQVVLEGQASQNLSNQSVPSIPSDTKPAVDHEGHQSKAADIADDHESSQKLVAGASVCIQGLQSRPDLNGKSGRVVGFDHDEKRWKVVVVDTDTRILLKSANINLQHDATARSYAGGAKMNGSQSGCFQSGDKVQVCGLTARQELNGCQVSLLEHDASQDVWKVAMIDGSCLSLRSSNLAMPEDSRRAPPPAEDEDTLSGESASNMHPKASDDILVPV